MASAVTSPSPAASTVHAVLWDMDGTLMDSQPYWDESFVRRCTERGGTISPGLVGELTGASIRRTHELIAATGAARSAQDPEASEIFRAMAQDVEEAVAAQPPLVPGAREITSTMAEVGLAQAIVSASPRAIVEHVAAALGNVFAVLVTGDDGVGAKPDPAPYATAIDRLELRPDECVVVEDSPTGAASARGNGIYVIQIGDHKYFPADPGLVVVPDLLAITPHLLLWARR